MVKKTTIKWPFRFLSMKSIIRHSTRYMPYAAFVLFRSFAFASILKRLSAISVASTTLNHNDGSTWIRFLHKIIVISMICAIKLSRFNNSQQHKVIAAIHKLLSIIMLLCAVFSR